MPHEQGVEAVFAPCAPKARLFPQSLKDLA